MCDHSIHGGILLIAKHLQEPSKTNFFTVGKDVAKGLDTTEPCSGTWDARKWRLWWDLGKRAKRNKRRGKWA